ncbi:hypothetical protein [Yinghuangia sp. YIM S09857]|uniref:hypothetical protein n=1 Tax=Yinghuangia sp. YIM S09857 TaxID=3436929 RepID=UPI003F5327F6
MTVTAPSATVPPLSLPLAALAEREPAHARAVLVRLTALYGPGALAPQLAVHSPVPDAFVAVVAEAGGEEERAALACNACLTPPQLRLLVEVGGEAIVRAVFSPLEPEVTHRWVSVQGEAGAGAPVDEGDPLTPADLARERIRDAACTRDQALELLAAHPELTYSARVRPHYRQRSAVGTLDLAPLLHRPDRVWRSLDPLVEPAKELLSWGAVTADDLAAHLRPALVAAQALARLTRDHAPMLHDDDAANAVVRPLLHGTVKADPHAWARLADTLGTAEGTLPQALAAAAQNPSPTPRIAPPARVRPALLHLLRRLEADDVAVLLPHLAEEVASDLISGNVAIPPGMLELAHATGNRALLRKIASHPHLRDEQARRLQAYEDTEFDRILAWNKAGISAAVRRDVLAGRSPNGGGRRPIDPELRQRVLAEPQHIEASTLVYCGDPALVCMALPDCRKLRRIDLIDVVLSVWERVGPEEVAGVVTSVPDAFPKAVRALVDEALARGSAEGLVEARARFDRGKRGPAKPRAAREPWDLPARERIREHPLPREGYDEWTRSLPPEDPVLIGRPALAALHTLRWHCRDGAGPRAREAIADGVLTVLGTDPEAWSVFAQLLPDFEGTLPELAGVCAAAVHRTG